MKKEIDELTLNFMNLCKSSCPRISFLEIEIANKVIWQTLLRRIFCKNEDK